MANPIRRIGTIFSAGAAGGVVNSLAVWLTGDLGITTAVGANLAPALTKAWLYPRIVWGGIWAFLFLLPWPRGAAWKRGLIFSLGPSAVQLLVIFPDQGSAILGLRLGVLTPLFVLVFNAIWGLMAAAWLKMSGGRS